ncbi:MAG: type II toxin-antitoxin system VapC family toxin [Rubrivivax sp.]|nr:type II toxin-antitoxin system VapC family toxin [Rubrivivax sp.]
MRLLLDTHVALWAVTDSERLPLRAAALILGADDVYVSAASVWEIAIKHALGRGQMPVSAAQALQAFDDSGYRILSVQASHAARVEALPLLHADPVDRLLVAQALDEPLTLLTSDPAVAAYSEAVLLV